MDDLAEKRVYASGDAANQLVVAASPGLVTVKVAGTGRDELVVADEPDYAKPPVGVGLLHRAHRVNTVLTAGRDMRVE